MFGRRRSQQDFDRLRDQRDTARRQRDRLVQRLRRLAAQLAEERAKPLQPPYGRLERLPHGDPGPERCWPVRDSAWTRPQDPGSQVAFATVANDRFLPGLRGLLLSLLAVYPDLSSPFVVFHDGSLDWLDRAELLEIYPHLIFEVPDPSWASALPRDSANRERIGVLGYLNTYALGLRGYERVIVLDSDVLVFAALDRLWAPGSAFRVVIDCGANPFGVVSGYSGRPVINSGVISIPGSALCDTMVSRMQALIGSSADAVCPCLDLFADQKVWNQLLIDQPVELLPINFNCNIKYVVQFLDGCIEGLALVHFAGPKPWLLHEQPRGRSKSITDHWLWIRTTRQLTWAWRLRQFQAHWEQLTATDLDGSTAWQRSTGLACAAFHPQVLVDSTEGAASWHLVLHSAEQLGPNGGRDPHWPADWVPGLSALADRPSMTLWAPFSLRHLIQVAAVPTGIDCRFILMELPFSAADLVESEQPGFAPWCGTAEASMRRAVSRQLGDSNLDWLD